VYFGGDEGEVLLTLNCNRGAATATTPGASMGSVASREFQAKGEEQAAAAAQSEEAELADVGEVPGVPGQVAGE
jgi:type IV secretory pathway TrbL component